METRSRRRLPADFNENPTPNRWGLYENQTSKKPDPRMRYGPALPAAFPTLEYPVPPAGQKGANRNNAIELDGVESDDNAYDDIKKRRIDMKPDDAFRELVGDTSWDDANKSFKEVGLESFGCSPTRQLPELVHNPRDTEPHSENSTLSEPGNFDAYGADRFSDNEESQQEREHVSILL